MAKDVDAAVARRTNQLASFTRLPSFAFFGGAVLDTILKRPVADYDICFTGDDGAERLSCVLEELRQHDFDIITPVKSYPIWLKYQAFVGVAKKGRWLLDIASLPSYDAIRFFTVDSMYVVYPDLRTVDTYDALGAYRRQEIKLARGIEQENPYRIATRAIRIGAKYGFPLQNAGSLWSELVDRLHGWQANSEFHGPFAYAEAAAKTLRAIVRSNNQPRFVAELLETGILTELFPELIAPLTLLGKKGATKWHTTNDRELLDRLLSLPLEVSNRRALMVRAAAIHSYGI